MCFSKALRTSTEFRPGVGFRIRAQSQLGLQTPWLGLLGPFSRRRVNCKVTLWGRSAGGQPRGDSNIPAAHSACFYYFFCTKYYKLTFRNENVIDTLQTSLTQQVYKFRQPSDTTNMNKFEKFSCNDQGHKQTWYFLPKNQILIQMAGSAMPF